MTGKDTLSGSLRRWQAAGLLDAQTVARIEAFEASQLPQQDDVGWGWHKVLAMVFGTLTLGAGILLFVAAHWEHLSPAVRFSLVLAMVAGFHGAGVLAGRHNRPLAQALHGVGTVSLGAGIFLAGQIFHLQEHWPTGVLLWGVGALVGKWLLGDWVQGWLCALLLPAWLLSEWCEMTRHVRWQSSTPTRVGMLGVFLLVLTYLTVREGYFQGWQRDDANLRQATLFHRALHWTGGILLLPAALCFAVFAGPERHPGVGQASPLCWNVASTGWLVALGLPLMLAYLWRGSLAWRNGVAAILCLAFIGVDLGNWGAYLWGAFASIGLVVWGLQEVRRDYVNLGIAGFAVTLLTFYFSSVMDKLGRSLGLMGLGLLLLFGGWLLARLRRQLTSTMKGCKHG